jgi:hypothetical protein
MSHRNQPRELGTAWERRGVDYAQAKGLPWERAPLRGTADLLDVQGCLPAGWLIGFKAKRPKTTEKNADRLSEAMNEARKAWLRLPEDARREVIPVQIVQRPQYPVGRAFAVMEYDDFLSLVLERAAADEGQEWDERNAYS